MKSHRYQTKRRMMWVQPHQQESQRTRQDTITSTSWDQEWYCQEATRHIDALALRGTKYEYDQDLEFPRIIDGVIVGDEDQNAVVPTLIKRACLEEALAIYANASGGRRKLQEEGVQSYTIGGKLSETFRLGAGQSSLESITAARILRRYTGVESR